MQRINTILCLVAFILVLPMSASATTPEYAKLRKQVTHDHFLPNGSFDVQVQQQGAWHTVGEVAFDAFYRTQRCELGPVPTSGGEIAVRLLRHGPGAAHIDAVSLDGAQPLLAASEPAARKLARQDFDVLHASGSLEYRFPVTDPHATLSMTARIEPERITKEPFKFPLSNTYHELDDASEYYAYDLETGQKGSPGQAGPLFKEYCLPGTGHPMGYASGWVWNDEENLYVYVDLEGDNTCDGDKDYAAVHVKTPQGVKTFRVSEKERVFGSPSFNYTESVAYEHKTYRFAIPRSELPTGDQPLQLAFSAYGTMAPGYDYMAKIPFNILNEDFWTGLHIKPDSPGTIEFSVLFIGQNQSYATEIFDITGELTTTVQGILSDPGDFQNPTYLYIESNTRFVVVQFIGKADGMGYSYQTFYSFPNDWNWPYEDEMILLK